MGAYSFSSLSDMLEQPPTHNSKLGESLPSQYPISKHQVPHENPPNYVTQMFGELYFKVSHSTSSSTQHFPAPPPPPQPASPSPNHTLAADSIGNSSDRTNFGRDKVGCVYNKKSWGRNERLFPPPISCLKTAKSGDPIVYFRFDENYGTFVPEERRIHRHGLLCASRNSGRLKLYFRREEPEEEEQEENDGKIAFAKVADWKMKLVLVIRTRNRKVKLIDTGEDNDVEKQEQMAETDGV
ncbi:hypothetical protein RHSIM_Rhsim03G0097600 [Rhododendron simsii]|uniref:FAF domain-containing protein n=1 Tax=Rhododendron simsii TaxID=118357 RepID=A0A834LQ02_RHOSS|nr:hypothetical protein RHSIM_Rhsim03G0097600 [Rhododendron simsii]